MKTLTIPRAKPFLPNSSPEVRRERRNAQGTFQVAWIDQIDAHGLFFTHDRGTSLLATHNNGYSCAALADRICAGDLSRVMDQADYLARCGGTVCDAGRLKYAVNGDNE